MTPPAKIIECRSELAATIASRLTERGHAADLDDLRSALLYLAEALTHDSLPLFTNWASWRKALLAGLGRSAEEINATLQFAGEALIESLGQASAAPALEMLTTTAEQLRFMPDEPPSHLGGQGRCGALAEAYLNSLVRCRRQEASSLIMDAIEEGLSVKDVYLDVFQPVLRETGRLWQMNRVSVAQEHYITAVTQSIMSQLYPRIFSGESRNRTVVACCVSGELHEVGVRMVADLFEMSGWDSHYLGANIPAAEVIELAQSTRADAIAVSATLTSHVGRVAELIALARQSLDDKATILVGGYPFNIDNSLWRKLGADGSAQNAADAIRIAEEGRWK